MNRPISPVRSVYSLYPVPMAVGSMPTNDSSVYRFYPGILSHGNPHDDVNPPTVPFGRSASRLHRDVPGTWPDQTVAKPIVYAPADIRLQEKREHRVSKAARQVVRSHRIPPNADLRSPVFGSSGRGIIGDLRLQGAVTFPPDAYFRDTFFHQKRRHGARPLPTQPLVVIAWPCPIGVGGDLDCAFGILRKCLHGSLQVPVHFRSESTLAPTECDDRLVQ